jgi:hypothetical protein
MPKLLAIEKRAIETRIRPSARSCASFSFSCAEAWSYNANEA